MSNEADFLDAVLHIDEQFIQDGYEQGRIIGQEVERKEGAALGVQKGFEIGNEVGFYEGCLQVWEALCISHPELFSDRSLKSLQILREKIAEFSWNDPRKEDILDVLDQIRGKFKQSKSQIGEPLPKASVQGVYF
eukprot:CAMPEP_0196652214 /NCGR_PEP_ID=MMETSP1086-20130531/1447_1 /TAXON_ID=77921 /ORGANISM="Cyanoptyche  gloeocystis , Strain SAG4.97" /LENGTH=134 /DNA_ID=CAMNT_0041982635 /DNA_START=80 /DNA_END=484 /DNA_ORIENTATION=+